MMMTMMMTKTMMNEFEYVNVLEYFPFGISHFPPELSMVPLNLEFEQALQNNSQQS